MLVDADMYTIRSHLDADVQWEMVLHMVFGQAGKLIDLIAAWVTIRKNMSWRRKNGTEE